MTAPWGADQWPIGAALLQFPDRTVDGVSVTQAGPEHWSRVLREVRAAGFDHVDLGDTWLRTGDLDGAGLRALADVLADADLRVSAITVTRRSILDPAAGEENLDYTLRTLEAAHRLGVTTVGLGLHRPLTPEQLAAEWFWSVPGAADPVDDSAVFDLAVERFAAIGSRAAELGTDVSLELYEDTLLGTADGAVALVKAIGLPNVGLNPDVGNLVRQHRPIEAWADVFAKTLPLANYWHIKNYYRAYDPVTGAYFAAPAAAAHGVIDYRWALRTALELGFRGPICVEHYGGDGLTVSAQNRDYLHDLLRVHLQDRHENRG